MLRGLALSDLHLLSKRGHQSWLIDKLSMLPKAYDFLVLNGDIFDFEWSQEPTIAGSVDKAISYLKALAQVNPECKIYYILGNHDCHVLFIERLKEISLPNFVWTETHIMLGKNLFLHGDLPLGFSRIYPRTNYEMITKSQPKYMSFIYERILDLGLAKCARFIYPPLKTVKRLYDVISSSELDFGGIEKVYFGHIHVPINALKYDHLVFYNTCSSVRGFKPNFLEIEI
jgi:UDP-2,3-diacylglucosamine hydrolase